MENKEKKIRRSRLKPVWLMILMHIVALGLALCLFALPHHVLSVERKSIGIVSSRNEAAHSTETVPIETAVAEAVPAGETQIMETQSLPADSRSEAAHSTETAPADTAVAEAVPAGETQIMETQSLPAVEPDAAPTASADSVGDFGRKFADKFIQGEPVITRDSYVSENLNIHIDYHYIEDAEYKGQDGSAFYVADIYIRDISCFQTAFAKGKFGKQITESMEKTAERTDAVLIMNGDYYGAHSPAICIRNGELYWEGDDETEIGVLFWDGTFQCFSNGNYDTWQLMRNGAYQAWSFGPALLDGNGHVREDFDRVYKSFSGPNPRSAFGYYEPGHYCFIVVDGRSEDSKGVSLSLLAEFSRRLGLKQCYNLDGGKTSVLGYMKQLVNEPGSGRRNCSDYLCIVDRVTE